MLSAVKRLRINKLQIQLNSPTLVLRNKIWGFSNNDDSSTTVEVIDSKSNSNDRSIVSHFGDDSPAISPLLILPTLKRPIFPGYLYPLTLRDEKTIEAIINHKDASNGYVGVFLVNDAKLDGVFEDSTITNMKHLYKVGTFSQIQNVIRTENGNALITLMGHRRINLETITSFGPPIIGNVFHWKKSQLKHQSPTIKAYTNEVISATRELIKLNPLLQEQIHQWVARIDFSDPFKVADFAAAITAADGPDLQRVLETSDPEERLSITLELITKDKELAKLQREINKQVEDKVSKQQKEYFLREQLKNIKKELGLEKDDKDDLINKYREKITVLESRGVSVSEETLSLIKDEVKKLESIDKNSPEFNVTRSYLDWLVAVPWGEYSEDVLNLNTAKFTLDEDHYGMKDIKDRILEFIAVGKLRGTVAGKILCFIGPPGVGKTSIAKSIASALNKKFYRFSVGGLSDTAEIKGHRRTYIGAMPGKPVQCLKTTGCLNPLILIDEIDKLGRGYSGDPASALLELLDPNQNNSFVDHYLDTPIDFSKVLFVCTANDEGSIPGPLLDRMEIIRPTGYDVQEKVAIASKYLVPKALEEAGLLIKSTDSNETNLNTVEITEDALHALVKNYCRESGVRSLEKMVNRVARKVAFQRVESMENQKDSTEMVIPMITVTANNLHEFIGKPIFTQDNIYYEMDDQQLQHETTALLPPGVVMGLAWNPLGGSSIFIETVAVPTAISERDLGVVSVVTGQLGSVMKESVQIAYTFARKFILTELDSQHPTTSTSSIVESNKTNYSDFFKSHQLHLHVPEGAVSKDGPSAGVAMASSVISVSMNKPLIPRVAMTGELSLTGKVLPVGGIKEKILAAKRAGANTLVLPLANRRDFEELPSYVKDSIAVHYASEYKQVYNIIFPK